MRDKLITKLKTPQGTAFISAFICGIAVHLFSMMNVMENLDTLFETPRGFGAGLSSGRWALEVLGRIANRLWGIYRMPSVNGFMFVLFVAIAAALAVTVLKLRRHMSAALCGALFIVFPCAVSTLLFYFTSQFYGFAILLAVFSAWVLVKPICIPRRGKDGQISAKPSYVLTFMFSGGAMAVSLGIYQAYFPLAASLLVLSLIGDCLRGEDSFSVIMRRALYYLANLAVGMLLYFILLRLALAFSSTGLTNYKGISSIGHISSGLLPFLLKYTRVAFFLLLHGNIYGLAPIRFINILYRLLGLLSVAGMVYIFTKKRQKPLVIALAAVLCCMFPYAVGLVRIMCPTNSLYDVTTIMVYGYVVVGFAPAVIMEALPEATGKPFAIVNAMLRKGSMLMLAVLIALYAYFDEVNYTAAYYTTAQMENYTTALVTQVRMTEGFDTEKQWVFIGDPNDPLLNNAWDVHPLYHFNLAYLQDVYTWKNWIGAYFAYDPPIATDEEVDAILARKDIHGELADMPVFPNYGSIKIIENMVVIKMGEID